LTIAPQQIVVWVWIAWHTAKSGGGSARVNWVMDEPGDFHYIFGAGLRGSEHQVITEERP
jgi:hypothetical protein